MYTEICVNMFANICKYGEGLECLTMSAKPLGKGKGQHGRQRWLAKKFIYICVFTIQTLPLHSAKPK